MKNVIKYIIILFLFPLAGFAQLKDTMLNMVLTKPYFCNIIQSKGNKIFVGTSKGIFEVDGTTLIQRNNQAGYITNDQNGLPIIYDNGLRNYKEKKYAYLLPFPELAREEYHASNKNFFYICSGGRLYIYDLLSYIYSYPYHSIRTISKDLVGTYSGVYLNGKILGNPNKPITSFVDGYIRQYGDRAFICNYSLIVLEKEALQTGKLILDKTYRVYLRPKLTMFNDIFPSPNNQHYFVATDYQLIKTNYTFTKDSILFSHHVKDAPIGLITQDIYNLFFYAANKLYYIDYAKGNIDSVVTLDKPILAGTFFDQIVYLLTSDKLYQLNTGSNPEKIADLHKAHSMIQISGSELVISTDNGLYLLNLASRILSVIIEDVEFNRKALHKEGNFIYAGSVNGLYTINVADIPLLIEKNKQVEYSSILKTDNKLMFVFAFASIAIISLIIYNYRRKIVKAERIIETLRSPKEMVSRAKIEDFILQNLPNASIKTISDKFDLHAPQIYAILEPERPGSIIQKLRIQTLKKMRAEGKTVTEIAAATGLSISYLKRLKA